MRIVYDEAKRLRIFEERGLDFADAGAVFDGFHMTRGDEKHSDVEDRFITVGNLHDTIVIVVWTERDEERRIITMWKANDRERHFYLRHRNRSG